MKHNMGTTDRIIRSIIAILFIALYAAGMISGTLGIILLVISGIFLLTSIAGFCPLYALLKINTCPRVINKQS